VNTSVAAPSQLAVASAGVLAAVAASYYTVDVVQGVYPKLFIGLLALAGAVVLFSIEPERLFLGWLLVAPLLQGVPATSWGHALEWILYLAPVVVLLVHTISPHGGRSRISWFDFMPAAYFLFASCSMVLTTNLLQTSPTSSVKALFLTAGLGPLVYYFVAFRAPTALTATKVVRVLLISCVIQGAMAAVEIATGWNLWRDYFWHVSGFRAVATLHNPAALGAFLGAGIALALAVLSWGGPRHLRRLSIAVLVIGVPGLVFTLTRGPIAAAAVVALPVVLLRGRTRFAAICVMFAALLAVVIAWPTITGTSLYRERVTNTRNVEARVVLQDWSLRLAKEKPILGWGYQSFDRVKNSANFSAGLLPVALGLDSTSHDTYLTVLVEYGGVGLFLLLAPFAAVASTALRRARAPSSDRWLLIGASAAVVALILAGTTYDYKYFSLMVALPYLLLALLRRAMADQDARASAS